MSAGQHNIEIEQGTEVRVRFEWTDSDDNPVNLTGADCRMQWRQSKGLTSKLIADVTNYLTLTAADGRVDLVIPGSVSIGYKFSTAHYSLRVDRPGDNRRLVEGLVVNSKETTV